MALIIQLLHYPPLSLVRFLPSHYQIELVRRIEHLINRKLWKSRPQLEEQFPLHQEME